MQTSDRAFGVLKLFTLDNPSWTPETIALRMGVSTATAYRFIGALEDAGLLTSFRTGIYVLGPAIIELDRQIQLTDPLLSAATPVMEDLCKYAPEGSVVLLCRAYSDHVLCMRQLFTSGLHPKVSYERGRPMPVLAGATSKVILAHQPLRRLRGIYASYATDIERLGLGTDFQAFRQSLNRIKSAGYAITRGEVDHGRIGIAAPILDEDKRAIASLSYVVSDEIEGRSAERLAALAQSGAREIEGSLAMNSPSRSQ